MIKINETSRELTKVEKYLMTASPAMVSMKDVEDGTSISVLAWCTFTDVKETTGESVDLLSILTTSSEVYSCQSETFKREFLTIVNLMENDDFSVIKFSGKTKAGRDFISCKLDITNL
jgi:hypothetical protein